MGLFLGNGFAQSAAECPANLSIFAEYAKVKNYDAAYTPWMEVRTNCPELNAATYVYGERILSHKIKNATDKTPFVEDLLTLYDEWLTYFPADRAGKSQKGKILASKAQAMLDYGVASKMEVYQIFDTARIDEVNNDVDFSSGLPILLDASLFVLSTDGSTVLINGLDIDSYPSAVKVGGVPADGRLYQIHRLNELVGGDLTGDISVVGSDELYVSYYNFDGAATSGAFYSGFTLEPRIFPEVTLNALGVCFDPVNGTNVTLSLPNSSNYDSWKWQKQDAATGSWSNILPGGSDPDTYTPTAYGVYRLEVDISCLAPNNIIYSDPLTVSVCPPDFDNDGIINNIDLDNDNDGVLDAIESYGNFDIDLTLSPPQINAPWEFCLRCL